jgi:hypothetical protein
MATTNRGRADTFDAGQFGTLRYDFKAYKGIQGIIPDPSDQQIEDFMLGMRDTAKEFQAGDIDPETIDRLSAEELQDLMDDDQNMRVVAAQEAISELVATLCSGSPSKDQLLALPFRVRQAFLRWLQGKLLDPEAGAAGTTPSRVTRLGG